VFQITSKMQSTPLVHGLIIVDFFELSC